jgi:UDP-glucose/iron transport system permease protein
MPYAHGGERHGKGGHMTPQVITISHWQLVWGLIFILGAGIMSLLHSLRLERDLLVGTVRTFVQLFALGYLLNIIFALDKVSWVMGLFLFMIFFAAWTIRGRIKEKQVAFFLPIFVSMLLSYFLVSYVVTAVLVGAKPWWQPQYFIPLSGMVIGNSMNAIAVSLDRLMGELKKQRQEIEMMLCLGADYKEASHTMLQSAIRAGMIPSINSMMAVGLVFIPGMMTGQILAGADPLMAIRYQIVVMVMIVGSTAIGSFIVVYLVRRRCFGPAFQLLLRP